MGYLTTIIIHNDALHSFRGDPKMFGEAIFEGIDKANQTREQADVGFKGYCNYISVEPPRHADDQTIFLHSGNCVTNLNSWNKDFQNLAQKNPKLAEDFLGRAQAIITASKRHLKKLEDQKPKSDG